MPNHTPEEWFADDGRDGTEQSWCLITDNGGLVAQRLYREDAEYIVKCLRDLKQAIELLRDASERLQDYCAQVNGDMNDSLGSRIDEFLDPARPKRCHEDQDHQAGGSPPAQGHAPADQLDLRPGRDHQDRHGARREGRRLPCQKAIRTGASPVHHS